MRRIVKKSAQRYKKSTRTVKAVLEDIVMQSIYEKAKRRVLIVDDDTLFRATIMGMLSDEFTCFEVDSGQKAVDFCRRLEQPDIILMDYNMPNVSGAEVCKRLQNIAQLKRVPVVFLSGENDPQLQHKCWEAGASDFVAKPVISETLKHRLMRQIELKQREIHLENLACTDSLTGLYNREYLKQHIPPLVRELNREHRSMSTLMIDIDDFKKYNDYYGHVEGDRVLKKVAHCLKQVINRPYDNIIRYGGEEFIVVLPRTNLDGAKLIAHKMSRAVERLLIENSHSAYGRVTVSIGVAASRENIALDFIDIVKKADKAMYKAKASGKNNVVADNDLSMQTSRYAMVGGSLKAI